MTVEVVIAGAGPAGAAAALTLATAGVRIQVVDRAPLPRDKPCGGAIPSAVWHQWADQTATMDVRTASGIWLFGSTESSRRVWLPTEMAFVNRRSFDAELLGTAIRAGQGRMTVRQAMAVCDLEEDDEGVHVRLSNGQSISTSYLVAADGAVGRIAKMAGLPSMHLTVAASADVDAPAALRDRIAREPVMDMGAVDGGYGWVFPGQDRLVCGIGSWKPRQRLRACFEQFLSRHLPPDGIQIQNWRVAPLPFYSPSRPVGTRRICLAGDAAGLVDPISGEGIQYALASGRLAAEAILSAAGGPITNYGDRIKTHIGGTLSRLVGFVQPLFLGAPDLFFDRLIAGGDYHGWFGGVVSE